MTGIRIFLSENFHFLVVNFSVYLNRRFRNGYELAYRRQMNMFYFIYRLKRLASRKMKVKIDPFEKVPTEDLVEGGLLTATGCFFFFFFSGN